VSSRLPVLGFAFNAVAVPSNLLQGGDPFNIFENVFGGGGGGGGGQRMHFQFNTGGGGGGMGGGMGGGGRRQRESAGLYDNDAFVQV
jgi:hypothetical protein